MKASSLTPYKKTSDKGQATVDLTTNSSSTGSSDSWSSSTRSPHTNTTITVNTGSESEATPAKSVQVTDEAHLRAELERLKETLDKRKVEAVIVKNNLKSAQDQIKLIIADNKSLSAKTEKAAQKSSE